MSAATPEDIANVCKLLERLRTGEMNLLPAVACIGERKQDASTEMLQRVESVLSDHLRRMQEPIDDGGAAFPVTNLLEDKRDGSTVLFHEDGMSLRDYFAAKAVHAIVTTPESFTLKGADDAAQLAYALADAMLKARQS